MPTLDHILEPILHVVAQIIEAELVVGAVGHIAVVGLLALLIVQPVHNHPDLEPKKAVDLSHPFGVALGQVIVHRYDVHAASGQRIKIDGERRHQRLAFAGLHFRDPPLVQDHPADELHVEVPLPERAFGRLAAGGKCLNENVVETHSLRYLLLECVGAGTQRLVR